MSETATLEAPVAETPPTAAPATNGTTPSSDEAKKRKRLPPDVIEAIKKAWKDHPAENVDFIKSKIERQFNIVIDDNEKLTRLRQPADEKPAEKPKAEKPKAKKSKPKKSKPAAKEAVTAPAAPSDLGDSLHVFALCTRLLAAAGGTKAALDRLAAVGKALDAV